MFFIINGINFLFLLHIFIVITIVIISIRFFLYLFIFLSPCHHQNYHYCYNQYTFSSFIYSFINFFIECQATCFKNSCYIFSKSGRYWYSNRNVCYLQGGYLVSIETEEEWHFINHEIQKRGTWNTSAWHIGLGKRDKGWTWESGEQLNISKWQDSQLDDNDDRVEISKNGSLFNGISWGDKNAFICEMPRSKITFQP